MLQVAEIVATQPISAQVCESQHKLVSALPVTRAGSLRAEYLSSPDSDSEAGR